MELHNGKFYDPEKMGISKLIAGHGTPLQSDYEKLQQLTIEVMRKHIEQLEKEIERLKAGR